MSQLVTLVNHYANETNQTCRICEKGFITIAVFDTFDGEGIVHKEYCSNALCPHNSEVTKRRYSK